MLYFHYFLILTNYHTIQYKHGKLKIIFEIIVLLLWINYRYAKRSLYTI